MAEVEEKLSVGVLCNAAGANPTAVGTQIAALVLPPDFSRKIPVMQDSAGGGCIMIIGAVIMGGAGIFRF